MKKALIEGATHNPGAPVGWKPEDGVCGGLPIRVDLPGKRCVSAWKPTLEELAILNEGGFVLLHVAGWQVPVMLEVGDRRTAQELE